MRWRKLWCQVVFGRGSFAWAARRSGRPAFGGRGVSGVGVQQPRLPTGSAAAGVAGLRWGEARPALWGSSRSGLSAESRQELCSPVLCRKCPQRPSTLMQPCFRCTDLTTWGLFSCSLFPLLFIVLTSWTPTFLRYFLARASTSVRELGCLRSRSSPKHLLSRRDQFARHGWVEGWVPSRMEVVQAEGGGHHVQMPSLQSGRHPRFPAGLL